MTIESVDHFFEPARAKRVVLKIGSALLVDDDGQLKSEWLDSLVDEIAEARARGQEVIVVSSGSVALGMAAVGEGVFNRDNLPDKQAAASIGQIELAGIWSRLLGAHGIKAAQLLLTLPNMDNRRRYLNVSSTLGRLIKAGVVPVVNENDSVATHELRFGDNDRLAARVAQAAKADALVLLSDIDGLYDRAPDHPDAEMQETVDGVTDEVRAMASDDSGSGMGTGGMSSKLRAAEIAERAGIAMAIINGTHHRPLSYVQSSHLGTVFLPQRNDGERKAWLGGRQDMQGSITVDAGCVDALNDGKSLLAAGITESDGAFARGDVVAVFDSQGRQVGQGLVEYHADEVALLKGSRTEHQGEILGYSPRSAVIHRDQLVLV